MTEQELPPIDPAQAIEPLAPHPESIPNPLSAASRIAPDIDGVVAGPWLRFFARFVDLQIWALLLAFMAGLFLPSLFENQSFLTGQLGSKVFGWILVPFAFGLDAAAYSLFGNTPGKWIAGIKVKSLAGGKVPFRTYLKRNFGLYWFGLGTDIPIVVLVTMWQNCGLAERHEAVRWDESTGTRPFIKGESPFRFGAIAAIWFLSYMWQTIQMFSH